MAYCTLEDIKGQLDETEIIRLTDDEDTGAIDESKVSDKIADADEEINAYVGARHIVPLDPVPVLVRKLSTDIAVYNLYSRRSGPPDHIKERYNNAIRLLEQVAKGLVSLGQRDPEGNPPPSDAPQMAGTNPTRVFSRDSLKGF